MKKLTAKIPQILLITIVLVLIGFSNGRLFNQEIRGNELNEKLTIVPDSLAYFKTYFPNCSFKGTGNHIEVFSQDGSYRATLLFTMPLCEKITGFGGNVPFVIVLNDTKVEQLIMLPNSETPNWMEGLRSQGFFDVWNGLEIHAALDKKVDAITGSTFTSTAVINSFQLTLADYAKAVKKKGR
jgi:Na+-translocating ferredoxin:NAD+ oxidoreductase RnfG subunit